MLMNLTLQYASASTRSFQLQAACLQITVNAMKNDYDKIREQFRNSRYGIVIILVMVWNVNLIIRIIVLFIILRGAMALCGRLDGWLHRPATRPQNFNQYGRWHAVRTRVTDKQTSFRTYERNLYNELNYNYSKSTVNISFYYPTKATRYNFDRRHPVMFISDNDFIQYSRLTQLI